MPWRLFSLCASPALSLHFCLHPSPTPRFHLVIRLPEGSNLCDTHPFPLSERDAGTCPYLLGVLTAASFNLSAAAVWQMARSIPLFASPINLTPHRWAREMQIRPVPPSLLSVSTQIEILHYLIRRARLWVSAFSTPLSLLLSLYLCFSISSHGATGTASRVNPHQLGRKCLAGGLCNKTPHCGMWIVPISHRPLFLDVRKCYFAPVTPALRGLILLFIRQPVRSVSSTRASPLIPRDY